MSPPHNLFRRVDAVLYDLDGTLIDTEPVAARALREALLDHGIALTPDDERHYVGKAWSGIFPQLQERHGLQTEKTHFTKRITDRYLEILAPGLPTLPWAQQSVQLLSQRYRLGMVSGSSKEQILNALAQLQIHHHFGAIFGFEDYPRSKPFPDGYLLCAAALGVDPQYCVVVEDSFAGATAAAAAGMTVVAISAGNHTGQDMSPAHVILPTLQELTEILMHL